MAQQGDCLQVIANDCIPHRLMLKVSRHAQWKARPSIGDLLRRVKSWNERAAGVSGFSMVCFCRL